MVQPDRTSKTAEVMGRRARKALAVRQGLFRAGMEAFSRQPVSLVSVLDITEAADVAKGVFYLHFPGKDAFLLALWREARWELLELMAAAGRDARSTRARIAAAAVAFWRLWIEHPQAVRLCLRLNAYFTDELGAPGEFDLLRAEYHTELTRLLGSNVSSNGGVSDRIAWIIDAIGWGLLTSMVQESSPKLDEATFVRVIQAAARAASTTGEG